MKNFPIPGAGHYSVAVSTGAVGAGASANSELLQFRWTSSTSLAVITEISLTGLYTTTAFAVGNLTLKATVARSWTADGSGGTDIDIQGGDSNLNSNQLRTNMEDSLVGGLRVATTAALTAGTKTLDVADIGQIVTHTSAGTSGATPIIGNQLLPSMVLFKSDIPNGQYPLVLTTSEGVVVRATVPATGVWIAGILIKWSEVLTTRF